MSNLNSGFCTLKGMGLGEFLSSWIAVSWGKRGVQLSKTHASIEEWEEYCWRFFDTPRALQWRTLLATAVGSDGSGEGYPGLDCFRSFTRTPATFYLTLLDARKTSTAMDPPQSLASPWLHYSTSLRIAFLGVHCVVSCAGALGNWTICRFYL